MNNTKEQASDSSTACSSTVQSSPPRPRSIWQNVWRWIVQFISVAALAVLIGIIVDVFDLSEKFSRSLAIRRLINSRMHAGDKTDAQGEHEVALSIYKDALTLSPNNPELLFRIARVQTEIVVARFLASRLSRRFTEQERQEVLKAVRDAEILNASEPTDRESRRILALARLANDQIDEAINILRELLADDRKNAGLWHDVGLAYDFKGKHDEADLHYSEAMKSDPQNFSFYLHRGNNRVRRVDRGKRPEEFKKAVMEAIEDYVKAVELNEKAWAVRVNKGLAHCFLEEYEEALAEYEKALEINPFVSRVYYYRGNVYLIRKEYARAVKEFGRATKLDKEDGLSFMKKALALRQLGRIKEAARDEETAEELLLRYSPGWVPKEACE